MNTTIHILKVIAWTLLSLLLVSVKILLGMILLLAKVLTLLTSLSTSILRKVDDALTFVGVKTNLLKEDDDNEPQLTGAELARMAGIAATKCQTIADIEKHFNISYRQARKVKDYIQAQKDDKDPEINLVDIPGVG